MCTSHEDQYTFMMSHSVLLRLGNVSDKSSRENQDTKFYANIFSFFFGNRAVYNKNISVPDRPQVTIWHLHSACCMPKATNMHSEYVTGLLIAFPLQR